MTFFNAADGEERRAPRLADIDRTILALRNISKSYGSHVVLRSTDLEVERGEFITLLGPSGSGKTTILKIIGGFTEPSSGSLLFQGKEIGTQPAHKRPFNTVFQDYALFPHMTVLQNVGIGLRFRGEPRKVWSQKAERTLDLVGLSGFGARPISKLSGGQKQRVALARALICQPSIVLLDEPLAALDADLRRQMQVFLKDIQRKVDTTFLFVTHDQEEAMTISDRIVLMDVGRIQQIGTPEDIYYRPNSEFAARFFGENNLFEARIGSDGAVEFAFGRVSPGVSGASVGKALVAIRPENIELEPGSAERSLSVQCTVVDTYFIGAIRKYILAPEKDASLRLLAKSTSNRALHFDSGSKVEAFIDLARINVIREGAS